MVKYAKSLTINLGNYQSVRLEVVEAESFEQCDAQLLTEIKRLGLAYYPHGVKSAE